MISGLSLSAAACNAATSSTAKNALSSFRLCGAPLRRAVPQNGADHVERSSAPQHRRRRRMPEQTCALGWGINPGLADRVADDVGHHAYVLERADWRVQREEYPVVRDAGPRSFEIGEHGVAGVLRKWQSRLSSTLAPDGQRGLLPVEIVEAQRDNVARAQAQTSQQEQDRPVSQAGRRCQVTRRDEPLDLRSVDVAW